VGVDKKAIRWFYDLCPLSRRYHPLPGPPPVNRFESFLRETGTIDLVLSKNQINQEILAVGENESATDENFVQKIRERAHALWEQEGRPEGRDAEFWFRAEQEIRQNREDQTEPAVRSGSDNEDYPANDILPSIEDGLQSNINILT
jgi:hypothetical protein